MLACVVIDCPRCHAAMDVFTRHGAPGAAPIVADMCLDCGGLWLDGPEVAAAYPSLSVLAERRADVLAVGERGAGIACCPRCEKPTLEVPFFDLSLDVCAACNGVWIDGDEIEALSRTIDRGDGLPAPDAVVGGYRTAAAGVMTKRVVRCAECGTDAPLRSTVSTPKGPVCQPCAKAIEADFESRPPVADDWEGPYEVPATEGFRGFVRNLGDALTIVLNLSPRCSACGCRSTSHCGH